MDSRTLVKKVIEFDGAPRIGYQFSQGYPNDFISFQPERKKDFDYSWHKAEDFLSHYPGLRDFDGYVRKDEFGNLWGKMINDPSPQGEVLYGVLSDWSQLDRYRLPELSGYARFAHMERTLKQCPDKFRLGSLPGFPFAIMRYMRKMEVFLADLMLEKEKVAQLHEMVVSELMNMIDRYADLGLDAIFFCEDWGTQDRLLISPELWREIFKPSFRKLCEHAHKKNMYVFMHSCGCIYEILEDLMEVGINVFQFDQPTLMGTDRIAPLFHGKATLFSPVDIQKTLPGGNREQIEEEAKQLVHKFFKKGGGFLARDYGDYSTIRVQEEWAGWMRDAFIKYGGDPK